MGKVSLVKVNGNNIDGYHVIHQPSEAELLETSIISAHKKYFGGNSESQGITEEESILYGTVIKYFAGKS